MSESISESSWEDTELESDKEFEEENKPDDEELVGDSGSVPIKPLRLGLSLIFWIIIPFRSFVLARLRGSSLFARADV